jgi:rod shape-determining protein MreD
MIRLVLLALLTALAFLLEPIVGSEIASSTFRPNILLIPFLVAILACPGPSAVVWGGVIGLVCDCLTGPCLGPQMAAFALLAALGSLVPAPPLSTMGLFFLSFGYAVAAEIVSSAIRLTLVGRPFVPTAAAVQATGTALTTALLISSVWLVARRLTRPLVRRRSDGERTVSIGWQRSAD